MDMGAIGIIITVLLSSGATYGLISRRVGRLETKIDNGLLSRVKELQDDFEEHCKEDKK